MTLIEAANQLNEAYHAFESSRKVVRAARKTPGLKKKFLGGYSDDPPDAVTAVRASLAKACISEILGRAIGAWSLGRSMLLMARTIQTASQISRLYAADGTSIFSCLPDLKPEDRLQLALKEWRAAELAQAAGRAPAS